MRPVPRNIFLIFWIIVALGCIGIIFESRVLDMIFKPLLMPALMVAVFFGGSESKGRRKILLALFFSFLGDVFLLLDENAAVFFISGLACFLVTHIFYISYFIQIKKPGASPVKDKPYLVLFIGVYTSLLLYLLFPHLGDLRIPVIIYALIISIMLYFSLSIPFSVNKEVRHLLITGAVFFVLSDSLLAINKFYHSFSSAGLLIRLTYCIAQFCIVKGFIKKYYY